MSEITNKMIQETFKKAKEKYKNIFSTDRWSNPSLTSDPVVGANNGGYRFYINVSTPQGTLKLSADTAVRNNSIVSVHLSSRQSVSFWDRKAEDERNGNL